MGKILREIFDFTIRRRWFAYGFCTLLCGLSLFRIANISPKNDLLDLLPENDATIKSYRTALNHFNPMELTYFDIHSSQTDDSLRRNKTADRLVAKLENSNLFRKITYKINENEIQEFLNTLRSHYPAYFSKNLEKNLKEKISKTAIIKSLNSWKEILHESPVPSLNKTFVQDPIGMDIELYNLAKEAYSEGDGISIKDGRIVSKDNEHTFIIATPKFPASNSAYATKVTNYINQSIVQLKSTDIDISYIGSHRFALLNETIMKRDIKMASSLSLLGILILCLLCFRKRFLPIFLLLPMAFGLIVSVGALTFLTQKISLITIGCGSILLGIVIDYGIHIIYSIDQDNSYDKNAIHRIVKKLFKPLTISALTTTIAFSCLYFSNFNSYKQFAIFASLGVICSYLFTVALFPTFFIGLKPSTKNAIISFETLYLIIFKSIAVYRRNVLIFVVIISALAALGATRIEFQEDLRKLYATNNEIQEDQRQISDSFKSVSTSTSLIIKEQSTEDALQKNSRLYDELLSLKKRGIVQSIKSLAPILPPISIQKNNLKQWNQFLAADKDTLIRNFDQALNELNLSRKAFSPFISRLTTSSQTLSINDFNQTSFKALTDKQFKESNQESYVLTNIQLNENTSFIDFKNIINKSFPEVITINSAYFLSYVMDLIPTELLHLSIIGLISVGTLLILTCGFTKVLQLLTPILISILWTLGLMGWVGVKFNIMNCVVILFMFGLVSDYSVFLTQAFSTSSKDPLKSITNSCAAITISVLTTIIGIGVLSLSKHPIFQSVGLTTLIGMISGYAAVIIIVPMLTRTRV